MAVEALDTGADQRDVTSELANWVSDLKPEDVTPRAYRWATHCFLDWFAVTIGGAHEPLVDMLVAEALDQEGSGSVPLVGRPEKVAPRWSVLINGSTGHALDFDDVNSDMHGHPTVPLVPALLTEARLAGASGKDMLLAFIAGYEVECMLGLMMGDGHYDQGFHSTATVGTLGAAAAISKLRGLDAEQTGMALGIAATQAAGLKSMFGTMCKPMHAGKAAESGWLAARLASRGFTAKPDGVECEQGFGPTLSPEFTPIAIRPDSSQPFEVENNLFKYHAACYLTHSPIEATRGLAQDNNLTTQDVEAIDIRVHPASLRVCNIQEPDTGLGIKFSLRHTAALAFLGEDTGAFDTYSDVNANRDDLVALRAKAQVAGWEGAGDSRSSAEIAIKLVDGTDLVRHIDVGVPASDTDAQEKLLIAKLHSLVDPLFGAECADQIAALALALEEAETVEPLMNAANR